MSTLGSTMFDNDAESGAASPDVMQPFAQPFGMASVPVASHGGMNQDMSAGNMSGMGGFGGPMGFSGDASGSMEGDMNSFDVDDDGDDQPLLQELGINFDHMWTKWLAVVMPWKELTAEVITDSDCACPLLLCLALGFGLLLTGKVHFGYIYGIGALGCVGMYTVLNLMSGGSRSRRGTGIDIVRVFSIQGYCLSPIVVLAFFSILIDLRGVFGMILAAVAILWSTFTAARFFEKALNMDHHRFLIAYPVLLQYGCFALITVF